MPVYWVYAEQTELTPYGPNRKMFRSAYGPRIFNLEQDIEKFMTLEISCQCTFNPFFLIKELDLKLKIKQKFKLNLYLSIDIKQAPLILFISQCLWIFCCSGEPMVFKSKSWLNMYVSKIICYLYWTFTFFLVTHYSEKKTLIFFHVSYLVICVSPTGAWLSRASR